ncbi:MAG: transcription antitermination factor NusB [Bdellovibrionales bacterium]|nr:transcription antitermination factor NusB [Bdellovibrionales bacterium]
MSSRHKSRELAVQFVFKWSLDPTRIGQKGDLDKFWREQSLSTDDNRPFFEELARGTAENLPQIDRTIESVLENWRFDRVEKVDLAVLRVAVFELMYTTSPEKPDAAVVIDEAIELAKKFGGAESSSFVNGVLDSIRKKKLA